MEGELEQVMVVLVVEVAWERRGQQWSKHCPLHIARSQPLENHTAAAAAMLVTTGIFKIQIFTKAFGAALSFFHFYLQIWSHFASNSSVLSGELPPAMGKTALFYHSGGSSGYESMLRDSSENTGSTSSAQDSLSEHSSATTSSRRSSKSSKKNRNNTGHNQITECIYAIRFNE